MLVITINFNGIPSNTAILWRIAKMSWLERLSAVALPEKNDSDCLSTTRCFSTLTAAIFGKDDGVGVCMALCIAGDGDG